MVLKDIKVNNVQITGVDNEPGFDYMTSDVLKINNVTFSKRNSNLLWTGTSFITNPGNNYEMVILKLEPSVYKLNNIPAIVGKASNYPVISGTDFTSAMIDCFPNGDKLFSVNETMYVIFTLNNGDSVTLTRIYKDVNYGLTITNYVSGGGKLIRRSNSVYSYVTYLMKKPLNYRFSCNIPVQVGYSDSDALYNN